VEVAPLLHNNEPVKPEAVNSELPQLSVTVILGVGTAEFIGAATPLPVILVQPVIVCVTVYVPAVTTVIEAVVSPVLHNKDPVKPAAVNTELPQLLATDTAGAFGVVLGVAVPLPALLVQPFSD
jgi:phage tail protein X